MIIAVLLIMGIGWLLLGLISGAFTSHSDDGRGSDYDDDNSSYSYDYDYDYSDSGSSSETKERFENRYPYEYDTETGYSHCIFGNGHWTDGVGNEYEQKTDCWGSVYYEKIEDDDD